MSEIDKLASSFQRRVEMSQQGQTAQIRLVECVSVDWDNKTMEAKGAADDVPYFDVSLGYGSLYIKPAPDTPCIIGMIEGENVNSFLIEAETIELIECTSDSIVLNEGKNKGMVKVVELTERLNAIEKAHNSFLNEYKNHNHLHPQGNTTGFIMPSSQNEISETNQDDIENPDVKH